MKLIVTLVLLASTSVMFPSGHKIETTYSSGYSNYVDKALMEGGI